MLEKSEWPSSAKLQRLRAAGVVSWSPFAARSAGSLGFLFAVWMLRDSFVDLGKEISKLSMENIVLLESWSSCLNLILKIVAAPVLAYLFGFYLCGLAQTRFFLRMDLISPRMSRLNPFRPLDPLKAVLRVLGALLTLVALLIVGFVAVRLSWGGLLYLLNQGREYILSWMPAMLEVALAPLSVVLGVGAILGWLMSKAFFLVENRMSREELRREILEGETYL